MPLPIAREGSHATSTDTLLSSAARTASGTSDQYHAPGVTALDVDLEDSFDGTTWNKVSDVNTSNITTTGVTVKRLNLVDTPSTGRLRVSYTVGGTTPSFTFTVKVHAIRGS